MFYLPRPLLAALLIAATSGALFIAPQLAEAQRVYRGQALLSRPLSRAARYKAAVLPKLFGAGFGALNRKQLSEVTASASLKRKSSISDRQEFIPYSRARNPCNAAVIKRLLRISKGLICEPDWEGQITMTPNDSLLSSMYPAGTTAAGRVFLREAWDLYTGSATTVVGIIDTGIEYQHLDLAANIWTNPTEIAANGLDDDGNGRVDDVHGYDFFNNDSDPIDDHSHGTAVAGTIGAVGNNARGVVGVNWNVTMIACKAFNASGSGSLSAVVNCLNYFVILKRDYGINMVATNNSYGGFPNSIAFLNAITATRDQDMVFSTAAGNSANDNDAAPYYPASFDLDNIIVAAATDSSGNLTSFSSFGHQSVDIAAPGIGVLTTILNNQYGYYQGTSIAGPHVTGALALVRGYHPSYTYAQAIESVLSTGSVKAGLSGVCATGSILNVSEALQHVASIPPTPTPSPPATVTAAPTIAPTSTPTAAPSATPTATTPAGDEIDLDTAKLAISVANLRSKSVVQCTLRASNGTQVVGLSDYRVTLVTQGLARKQHATTNAEGRASFNLLPARGSQLSVRCTATITKPQSSEARVVRSKFGLAQLRAR